jgi:hypothetical protein
MPASSFDRLFGDADDLLGSVFLDSTAPTLSAASLHALVVTSGVVDISQAKATYGHWRTKMKCKSDPTLHYWKNHAALPAYLSSQVKALNPTNLDYDELHTEPVGCLLIVTQLINPANALAPSLPVVTLVAAFP